MVVQCNRHRRVVPVGQQGPALILIMSRFPYKGETESFSRTKDLKSFEVIFD